MSWSHQELYIDLAPGRRIRRPPKMDHRKVRCGTCSALSSTPGHYRHDRLRHKNSACRFYSYSIRQQCTTTAIAKTRTAASNTNRRYRSNTNKTVAESRHNSRTSHSPLLVLFALLNLTLLVPPCKEVAGAPAAPPSTSGQPGPESMIKVTRFHVPPQVRPGELRRLTCLYELNGATLHAMKLFKDDKEFYRFTPNPGTPSDRKMTFPVVGVHVELNRSNENEVWLKTGKRSSGQYKCQVSIEGTFNSISTEKRMEVVDSSQFDSGQAQSSSGHLAGASLWQQPQQYDKTTTSRQHGSFGMTIPRAKTSAQRHASQVNSAASSGGLTVNGLPLVSLSWPLLLLVSLLAQIVTTQVTLRELRQTACGYKLESRPPPS